MLDDGLNLQSLICLGAYAAIRNIDAPILLIKNNAARTLVNFKTSPEQLSKTSALLTATKALRGYLDPNTFIAPLKKTERNSFSSFITVGRACNNDFVINDRTVSKVHGWFLMPEGNYSLWRFVDNCSTNGTIISNEKLPPNCPKFIRPGDEIQIGNVQMLFITGEDAFNLCHYIKAEWSRTKDLKVPKYVNADTIRVDATSNSSF